MKESSWTLADFMKSACKRTKQKEQKKDKHPPLPELKSGPSAWWALRAQVLPGGEMEGWGMGRGREGKGKAEWIGKAKDKTGDGSASAYRSIQ